MSPHDELDLHQIDALLGEDDFSEDDEILGIDEEDDFDDLLGAEDDFDSEDEEDSLDELLGAIDADYLSDEEKVFLQNKAFLDSNSPGALDKFFMEFQETLYGAMCDYAGEEEEEEFGAEEEELSDLEIEVDLMGGHAFGSDEEAEDFIEEYGFLFPLAPLAAAAGISVASGAAKHIGEGVSKAGGFILDHHPLTKKQRKKSRRARMRRARMSRASRMRRARMSRASRMRRSGFRFGGETEQYGILAPALAVGIATRLRKTKQRYIRQLRQLNRCVKRFERLAGKVDPNMSIKILAAKSRFLQAPFTSLALASEGNANAMQNILSNGQFKPKNRRLARVANRCDRKFRTLRRIYGSLHAKGKNAGVQPPRIALHGLLKKLSMNARKASKKSGGIIAAATIAAPIAARGQARGVGARRITASNLAKLRSANLRQKMKDRKAITLAKLAAARQSIAENRSEAREERKELSLVASNPYMDAADMLSLDRARQDRTATSAVARQAKIQDMRRNSRRNQREAEVQRLRKQRELDMKRRRAMVSRPKPSPITRPKPSPIRRPVVNNANVVLKRRIEITEKQLASVSAGHRSSLASQQRLNKGSTVYNAQYQKTRAFAQKSTQLRKKLASLKSQLR